MKTISVKLPDDLSQELDNILATSGFSNKSSVIRVALEYYIKNKVLKTSPKSFLASSQDLCGCISAETDLATNQDFLQGYGE